MDENTQYNQNNQTPINPNNTPPLNNPSDSANQQTFTPRQQSDSQPTPPAQQVSNLQSKGAPSQPQVSEQEVFAPPQDIPEPTIREKKGGGKKIFLIILLFLVVVTVGLFFASQYFSNLSIPDILNFSPITQDVQNTTTQTSSQSPNTNSSTPTAEGLNQVDSSNTTEDLDSAFVACGNPRVQVLQPNTEQVFSVGQTIELDWDLCGINPQLVNEVAVDYFDSETSQKIGDFNVFCADSVDIQNETSLLWTIPPYVESGSGNCTTQQEVDFADDYIYKLRLVYANQQYQDSSDTFFTIDTSEFVYQPPVFNNYAVEIETGFDRASAVADSVIGPLQNQIQPSFFAAPPTFANYYRLYDLSCGAGCFAGSFIVDLRTGDAHATPVTMNLENLKNSNYQVDSNLFIVELTADTLGEQGQDTRVQWYEFDEDTKNFSLIDTKLCNTLENDFVDCIQP